MPPTKWRVFLRICKVTMSSAHWWLYVCVVLVGTLSPGPAVVLAMSNGAVWGRRAAVFSSLGNIAGLAMLACAALGGIGGILLAWPVAYKALQLAGATYLIYLGLRKWLTASMPEARRNGQHVPSPTDLFVRGMLLALSNPKAILFFMALMPQFIVASQPLLPQFALLTGVLLFFSFSALMTYATVAHVAQRTVPGARFLIATNKLMACVFVMLGILMVFTTVRS